MTGMAVLLLARPIVRHRDGFAQSDERGDGWSADGEHLDRAREHRGSNAGFLLSHHLGTGRPRQSDGSVAAVRVSGPAAGKTTLLTSALGCLISLSVADMGREPPAGRPMRWHANLPTLALARQPFSGQGLRISP